MNASQKLSAHQALPHQILPGQILLELSDAEKNEYQAFNDLNGNILQDWEWGDFQKSRGSDVRRFFLVGAENGSREIIASAQVIVHKVRNKIYFQMPYGPVVADLKNFASENNQDHEHDQDKAKFYVSSIESICKMLAEMYEGLIFIRVEPQINFSSDSPSNNSLNGSRNGSSFVKCQDTNPHKTLVLDLKKPAAQLLKEMHPKTRYNIKIAQREKVEIRVQNNIDQNAIRVLNDTARRSHIRLYSADYYETLLNFFAHDGGRIKTKLYTAWHADDLIAVNLMLYYKDQRAIYLFGGSADIKRQMKGPHLLQWQAIADASSQGYSLYDFWGIEEDPSHAWAGFSRFKMGFGGEVISYAGTYDKVIKPAWYTMYKALRKLNRLILR